MDDAIIAIESMVVKMEEEWIASGPRLMPEPHRSADACRDAGNRNRVFAGGFCAFDRGRICRKHLLDCRIL